MAHIQDRWENVVDGRRVRSKRYGQGKRWKARYLDPDGSERSRTFDRKQDAERFLAGISADIVRGAYVDPNAGRITFADFSSEWLAAQTFSESTWEATELRIRLHAVPVLGRHELRNIKPSTIQAWLRGLQSKLAPTYVRTILTNVSAVLNAAVDDGLIASNPCKAKSVRPPALEKKKIEPWPIDHVQAVIDELPERYRCLGVVAAGCGLRQGEVFGLRVRDIDYLRRRLRVEQQVKLVKSRITIDRPKFGKTRVVPLPDWVAVELTEQLRRRVSERRRRVPRPLRPWVHPPGLCPPLPEQRRPSTPSDRSGNAKERVSPVVPTLMDALLNTWRMRSTTGASSCVAHFRRSLRSCSVGSG